MSIFSTEVETKEVHKKEQLRTHYYRNNFNDVLNAFNKIAEEDNMEVQHVDKKWGEVYIIANGYEVIAIVNQITPLETAVDFKINYFVTFGFNRPMKRAIHLYERLDSMLNFKGTMLHVN